MTAIQELVTATINAWNENLKSNNLDYFILLKARCRNKEFEVSIGNTFEQRVAELLLIKAPLENSKEKALLLFRKELRMPDKVRNKEELKHVSVSSLENSYLDSLYKSLLYESIGLFSITTEQTIKSKDYAEYDIETERLKPDPEFEGMIIETIEAGLFYEVGDKFHVFTQVEDGWGVYTAHDCSRYNNGIVKIPGKCCKVIQEKKVKIELLKKDIPKIIL